MGKWMAEFKTKFNDDFYTGSVISIYSALGEAMAKAKSTDPVKVAAAMSGLNPIGSRSSSPKACAAQD